MREKSIRVSEKHGLNPSITHCEICGKEMGVAFFGRIKGDQQAPRDVYLGLCDDCKRVIDSGGVMIIEVRDGERGPNPYRTGRIVGCSKDFKERNVIESPAIYMEQKMFSQLFDEALNNSNN